MLADPEHNLLLRWVNKITPESYGSSHSRPDAIISVLNQDNYNKTVGHGEAKVSEPTRNSDALARDLLRLAVFGKDSVDGGGIPLGFQIHGK